MSTDISQRLAAAMLGAIELGAIDLGRRLGYFRVLNSLGNANASELAGAAGANQRYTREWLEYMAVADLISVYEQSDNSDARRYALAPDSRDALCDEDGEFGMIHDASFLQASLLRLDDLERVFREGTGIPFSAFGDRARIEQELSTRRAFVQDMAAQWLPALGGLHQRLRDEPGGRVADLGFGGGWSTIALARAFPDADIVGLDLDAASVELARANAEREGPADQIDFRLQDAADPDLAGTFDLVCAFECLHDFTQPVQVLRAMRGMLRPGGMVMTGDPAVASVFAAPGDADDRMAYGFSLFHCLPVGMDGAGAVGTGTVMRESTVRSYASAAGFATIRVLEIDHPTWRFFGMSD